MKSFFLSILPVFIFITVSISSGAQSEDPATNKRIVESKNFIFKAQSALPTQGKTWQLTTEYDLTVSGDTIIAFLPYFGRAYTAPINPSEGGIKFTSTNADYSMTTKKKRWQITIKPKDVTDIQQLYLDISESGYATLRVISLNRQPISFNGYIVEGKEKLKKAF